MPARARLARALLGGLAPALLPAVAAGVWALPDPAAAQIPGTRYSLGETPPVVTIDQERLFAESGFGRAVEAEVERAARALGEENRRLERELAQEEQALTQQRAELPAEEFRPLADAFGARVEEIRRTQEARGRAIGNFRDAQRQRFFEAALPVITEVVVASGAVAVLDNRALILALDQIDITDRVLAQVDGAIGPDAVPPIPDEPSAADAPAQPFPSGEVLPDYGLPSETRPRARPPAPDGGPPLDLPLSGVEE